MLTGVGGTEGELARVGAFGVDDAVVVIEDFVDGDGDGKVRVCVEGAVLGFEGAVVAWKTINQSEVTFVEDFGKGCSPTTMVSLGSSS